MTSLLAGLADDGFLDTEIRLCGPGGRMGTRLGHVGRQQQPRHRFGTVGIVLELRAQTRCLRARVAAVLGLIFSVRVDTLDYTGELEQMRELEKELEQAQRDDRRHDHTEQAYEETDAPGTRGVGERNCRWHKTSIGAETGPVGALRHM